MPNLNKCIKHIDVWLENVHSNVNTSSERWHGSLIVNDVFDQESGQRFKSHEERLLFRLETWIDICRGDIINGILPMGYGKCRTAKNIRRVTKSIRNPVTKSLTSRSLDSLNSLDSDEKYNNNPLNKLDVSKSMTLSPAYSTSDLSNSFNDRICLNIGISDSSLSSSLEEEKNVHKTMRFPFFSFGKSQRSTDNKIRKQRDIKKMTLKERVRTLTYRPKRKSTDINELFDNDQHKDKDCNSSYLSCDSYRNSGYVSDESQSHSGYISGESQRNSTHISDEDQRNSKYATDEENENDSSGLGTTRRRALSFTERLTEYPQDEIILKTQSRYRPSLFDMKEFVGSVPMMTSVTIANSRHYGNEENEEYSKEMKYSTISSMTDTLFRKGHNDSIRYLSQRHKFKEERQVRDLTRNEADIGNI